MSGSRANEIPVAEWVCAALGLVVLLALVGWLAHRAITPGGTPPDLRVERAAIERGRHGWRVDVRVRNEGGSAAEGVVVRGELRRGGVLLGESEIELPYVPSGSERHLTLVFRDDPRSGELAVDVLGFVRP